MLSQMTLYDFEFPIGTVLRLVHGLNKDKAKVGAKAIVVDGIKDFPDYYDDLLANISPDDVKEFIGVVWDKKDPNYNGAESGFYMKHRFDIHPDQTDFRVCNSKIKNNENRESCFQCGSTTIMVQGFTSNYKICPKCKI